MEVTTLLVVLRLFLRFLLGSILLCSGIAKVVHPQRTSQAIRDYKIFSPTLETRIPVMMTFSVGMTLAEIVAGLGLISGFWMLLAGGLALCLFLIFSGALVVNLARGRTDLSCHCGGVLGDHRISWWLVGRNGLFLATTLFLLGLPPDPFTVDHSPVPGLTAWVNTAVPIALVVGALLVVFALFNAARVLLRT